MTHYSTKHAAATRTLFEWKGINTIYLMERKWNRHCKISACICRRIHHENVWPCLELANSRKKERRVIQFSKWKWNKDGEISAIFRISCRCGEYLDAKYYINVKITIFTSSTSCRTLYIQLLWLGLPQILYLLSLTIKPILIEMKLRKQYSILHNPKYRKNDAREILNSSK